MAKVIRSVVLFLFLSAVVLSAGRGDFRPSPLDLAVSPYKYSLLQWELSNFMDKWVRQAGQLLPWMPEDVRSVKNQLAQDFFELGRRKSSLERRLSFSATNGEVLSAEEARSLRTEIEEIVERRAAMRPQVEEAVEAEISSILGDANFKSRIGLIFPPVDTVYSSSPTVLVLSPRDRIHRQETILLAPGISSEERNRIEEIVLREENLAALVEDTGGVATYPSVVSDASSMHHAVVITAHEWLHHWFFFQPLGQHFWDSSEMTTLNETAATLGGQEIGDLAFSAMTGEKGARGPKSGSPPIPGAFDFNDTMRETRLKTEELLAQGKIEEAESYMEERRQFIADNGRFIRKINQAFFAFHGSYADSPASVSPINEQLKELRRRSDSLEDFLKTVASFSSIQEFTEYLASTDTAVKSARNTSAILGWPTQP
jgi:predicted translin family RNA/ssDNA-binding protein